MKQKYYLWKTNSTLINVLKNQTNKRSKHRTHFYNTDRLPYRPIEQLNGSNGLCVLWFQINLDKTICNY